MCVREGTPTNTTSTHPVEHISEATNSPGLFDEWVTEDLVPLGIAVEVLRNRRPGQQRGSGDG